MKRPTTTSCPRCGRALERQRRTTLDRVRSLFADKARYRCAARCGWEGLLLRIPRDSGRSRYVIDAPQPGCDALMHRYGSH